jgi:hypothetical protein
MVKAIKGVVAIRRHPIRSVALAIGLTFGGVVPLVLASVLSTNHAFAQSSESAAGGAPMTLSQGLIAAVQQLRGSQGVVLSGTPTEGFGSLDGTDSSGPFLLYYNQTNPSAPITGVIIDTKALAQTASSVGGVQTIQFVMDPDSFEVVSSNHSVHGILDGGTIESGPSAATTS